MVLEILYQSAKIEVEQSDFCYYFTSKNIKKKTHTNRKLTFAGGAPSAGLSVSIFYLVKGEARISTTGKSGMPGDSLPTIGKTKNCDTIF